MKNSQQQQRQQQRQAVLTTASGEQQEHLREVEDNGDERAAANVEQELGEEKPIAGTSQLQNNWAERLENVLNDYDALQQFQAWLGVDEDSSEHPLRLHFALLAYRERVAARDVQRAPQLAASIFNKFLRPHSGLCKFIDAKARETVGAQIAAFHKPPSGSSSSLSLKAGASSDFLPDAQLFAPCEPDLYKFLRRQHALFCNSQEFLEFYNASCGARALSPPPLPLFVSANTNASAVSCSSAASLVVRPAASNALQAGANLKNFVTLTTKCQQSSHLQQQMESSNVCATPAEQQQRQQIKQQHVAAAFGTSARRSKKSAAATSTAAAVAASADQPPKLTANSLYRSQRERDATLGQSKLEKMFNPAGSNRPVSRYPYVSGHATTSKNDSAVSSSFSSDVSRLQQQQQQHNAGGGGTFSGNLSQIPVQSPIHARYQQQPQQIGYFQQQRSAQPQLQSSQQQAQKKLRDEQRRLNPPVHNPFPKQDRTLGGGVLPLQFNHDTVEGRNKFADILSDELKKVIAQRNNEELLGAEKRAEKEATEDESSTSANNFFLARRICADEMEEKERDDLSLDAAAVDDDVDAYFRRRLLHAPGAQGDTSTLNSSQQQTPPTVSLMMGAQPPLLPPFHDSSELMAGSIMSGSAAKNTNKYQQQRPRRRSQRSCSPERCNRSFGENMLQFGVNFAQLDSSQHHSNYHAQQQHQPQQYHQHNHHQPTSTTTTTTAAALMSQSYFTPADNNNSYSFMQHAQQHQQALVPANCQFDDCRQLSANSNMTQSCLACPQRANPTADSFHLPLSQLQPLPQPQHLQKQQQQQQQQQQHRKGFAPPPGKTATQCNEIYCDNDCDTSGIGSMTYISDIPLAMSYGASSTQHAENSNINNSGVGSGGGGSGGAQMQIPRQNFRAAVFKKAREQKAREKSTGNEGATTTVAVVAAAIGATTTKCSASGAGGGCDSTPIAAEKLRSKVAANCVDEPQPQEQQQAQKVVITCRNRVHAKASDASATVPLVAHVALNKGGITLKEFRRYLSIPSKEKKRFFFKTICEDGSAPYQLLMINDNSVTLPIFNGKISAECCSVSDSE